MAGCRFQSKVIFADATISIPYTELTYHATEIKADEKGKKEYDDQLAKLARRKAEIQKRLSENETWSANFDRDIGPFESEQFCWLPYIYCFTMTYSTVPRRTIRGNDGPNERAVQ